MEPAEKAARAEPVGYAAEAVHFFSAAAAANMSTGARKARFVTTSVFRTGRSKRTERPRRAGGVTTIAAFESTPPRAITMLPNEQDRL